MTPKSPLDSLQSLINLADVERVARPRLPRRALDYFRSGAHDEITLSRNQAAYRELELHYRVLVDVSERSLATTVLGQPIAMPVMVAPTAFHQLAHPDGELATARAAGEAGTIMILSTLSNTPIEDVVAASGGPVWFQLYVYRDRAVSEALVRRAEAAGVKALVLTVDAPLLGRRERDVRNRFRLPHDMTVANILGAGSPSLGNTSRDSGLAAYFADLLDPSLSWKDLEWLAALTDLPILIKGVVRPDDAVRAVQYGAAGIVVSNHGGRQLDTSPPTIRVLEPIAEAVDGKLELLVDGGVRRGTDVIKALALGARAVLIGRPVLWGLAIGGQAGVGHVLGLLRDEVDLGLALTGCPDATAISRDFVEWVR